MQAGRHDARVRDIQLGYTTNGKEQLGIEFETADGTIWAYRFFTDKALQYTEADLRTLGWDPTTNGWALDRLIISRAIVGAECSIVVEEEFYEGKGRLKVKFINERGGGGMKSPMEASQMGGFLAQLRARVGMNGSMASTSATTSRPADRPLVDEDDIPF